MTPTQQQVRDVMRPNKKQTRAQIAEACGLSPAIVGRALVALATNHHSVVRIPATDAREVDRWRAATLDERHSGDFALRASDGTIIADVPLPDSHFTGEKAPRKAPSPLRAEVAAYLASAEQPVSAHTIGKALGRSAGAVQNCLDRLVEAGEAEQTSPRPRPYASVAPR
jgi:predicted ArsR family transcriptional regulator